MRKRITRQNGRGPGSGTGSGHCHPSGWDLGQATFPECQFLYLKSRQNHVY